MTPPERGYSIRPWAGGVFISYARADTVFARRLYAALAEAGQSAWIDLENLRPGVSWQEGIKGAIEAAGAFAFVVSPDSLVSEQCLQEIGHARAHRKLIVPLVHRDPDRIPVPDDLAPEMWIFARREDDFDAALRTFRSRIQGGAI